MYDNASEMYNIYLETYFDNNMALSGNKKSWVTNMILLIYFLKDIIMKSGLKLKNRLIR